MSFIFHFLIQVTQIDGKASEIETISCVFILCFTHRLGGRIAVKSGETGDRHETTFCVPDFIVQSWIGIWVVTLSGTVLKNERVLLTNCSLWTLSLCRLVRASSCRTVIVDRTSIAVTLVLGSTLGTELTLRTQMVKLVLWLCTIVTPVTWLTLGCGLECVPEIEIQEHAHWQQAIDLRVTHVALRTRLRLRE